MKHWAPLLLAITASVQGEVVPVYYDYVEGGKLTGGRVMVDLSDPAQRAALGLEELIARRAWPVVTIIDNGPTDNRIDLVILGDGYVATEIGDYAVHVENMLSTFFTEDPLAAYATYFNVHRVDVVSNESGVDEPDNGIYRDTALDMTYNCVGIPRLLCVNLGKAAAAASSAPDVDQILALANSTRYGGAGYPGSSLCTIAGDNAASIEIGLHEFGHSFALLADEYHYSDGATYTGPEPGEPNVSIYDAADQAVLETKWWLWLDLPNVDAFEGAMYNQYGVYRPTVNSKMRSLGRPFEEVNVEQFVLNIYRTVAPIDNATPPSESPLSACTTFFVTPLEPTDHALDIQWSVDGLDAPQAVETTFTPDLEGLAPGIHTVAVTVVDNTPRLRDESLRATWLTATRQWQIEVLGTANECGPSIPTISGLGMMVLTVLLMIGGAVVISRRHSAQPD